jgi:hypothetical protein
VISATLRILKAECGDHMFRYQCWGLLLIAASSAAGATPGAIHCGKLLDVLTGRVLSDWVVVFEGSSITAVGPAASTNVPAGVSPVDLAAVTCLPGLIDDHTHLLDGPTDNGYEGLGISVPRGAVTGVKNARITLHAGFTTVRNLNAASKQAGAVAGTRAAGYPVAYQRQRARCARLREKAQSQRRHPQRGGPAMSGYIYQFEEDLSQARRILLGLPD